MSICKCLFPRILRKEDLLTIFSFVGSVYFLARYINLATSIVRYATHVSESVFAAVDTFSAVSFPLSLTLMHSLRVPLLVSDPCALACCENKLTSVLALRNSRLVSFLPGRFFSPLIDVSSPLD